ncbi:LytR/AlgR family response regulator transcription factor [Massilia yuzhufengensis]|uniref:Two component transcriptional regulator, LytTR family n=1 Tax=Massilia yuzhufengensis TaxID=1164594 RepID=A0A1I1UJ96_9BURK|nr:LytTR family DNA-binding domain-containing protein [Massilia yuzhufengensis]SFD70764.1 two component transcriptional regulator, LytTR family [Massilia yuzhufengensis]
MTRVLIAEDEPLMRERLVGLLATSWPEADIVMVAENGNDAWDGFLEHEPDVVFLDIRMPGLSGLEVAGRIGDNAHVVFVTAYDQYAVDAFDAGAVDYLLKPVQADRMERAVARIRAKLSKPPADLGDLLRHLKSALPGAPVEKMKWIKATVGRQIRLIDVDEVLFFQSDSKYTRVVLADSEALVRIPLKDLLGGLDSDRFWQIHRGTLVKVSAIAAVEKLDAERMQVLLRGCDEKLAVSRTFTHLFRD